MKLEPIGATGGRPARVVEAIYLGQMVRYHLALDGGEGAADGGGRAVRRQRCGRRASPSRCRGMRADIWPVA